MDFNDTPEEAAFRTEAKTWLTAQAPTEAELSGLSDMARAKLWQQRKAEAGWACIRWP
ncbi:MAG: acyl-CoA dehydrogenase, partial [Cyclobacteriaceae bacterium]